MTTNDPKIVNPTSVRHPARYRGVLNSKDTNDFQEGVVKDIHDNARGINVLNSRLESSLVTMHNEVAYLRRLVDLLLNQRDYVEKADALDFGINRFMDFNDTRGIFFPNGLDDKFSALVSAQFGEATLPANAIENRFYTTSVRSGLIVTAPDLASRVTSVFDKGDGDGLVDYERGGKVTPGKPEWAFNGNNQRYWRRRVEFPLDSRVDQVEVEITVDVPSGASSEANLLEVYPFPNGSVDLQSLSTAGNLANSFTLVPGFTATDNISYKRYHFSVIRVERIKVRLRQRNWVEENGKKVFYYGMQELALKLVDYDKNYSANASFGKNHTFISKVTAPVGFGFNQIHKIFPDPDFFLEDTGKRHVRLRIGTDATFSSFLWDSDSNVEPQRSGTLVSLGNATDLYAAFELQFVEDTGGSLSPYPVGTTPYVRGLGLSYTLKEL